MCIRDSIKRSCIRPGSRIHPVVLKSTARDLYVAAEIICRTRSVHTDAGAVLRRLLRAQIFKSAVRSRQLFYSCPRMVSVIVQIETRQIFSQTVYRCLLYTSCIQQGRNISIATLAVLVGICAASSHSGTLTAAAGRTVSGTASRSSCTSSAVSAPGARTAISAAGTGSSAFAGFTSGTACSRVFVINQSHLGRIFAVYLSLIHI